MKRLFAYRPMLFSALYLCLGILIAYFYFAGKGVELAIGFVFLFFLPIFVVFWRKHIRLTTILMCFAVLGFSLFNIAVDKFENGRIDSTECQISGIVTKSVVEKNNYMRFYMRDCVVYLPDGTSEKLDGIVRVRSYILQDYMPQNVELGTHITFETEIKPTKLLDDNKNIDSFVYKMDIRYDCSIESTNNLAVSHDEATIAERINVFVLEMLLDNMSQENAYLAWSVLFGDSTQLDENVVEAFKVSGVMHIIAVSGMNVVFILAIIMGFLSLINVKNKYARFFTVAGVLIFYCWLCSFTPSVVRATLMTLVFLLAKLFGRQGDAWSNIGFCAILILLIQPLMLFEPGFLLSFGSLIGIILVNDTLYRFFKRKLHLPKWLSLSLSATISAQLGIFPIMALFFGDFSTYSFLANIIIVPIFELAYLILFVLVIVVSIIPHASIFLVVPELAFSFINWFPTLFLMLPASYLVVYQMGIFSVVFMLLLVFMSNYVFVSKKFRLITCCVLSAMVFLCIGLSYVVNIKKDFLHVDTYNGSLDIVYDSKHNKNIMVGTLNTQSVSEDLYTSLQKDEKIYNMDYIILWEESILGGGNVASLKAFCLLYNPDYVYLSQAHIDNYALSSWLYDNNIDYKKISDTAIYHNHLMMKTFGADTPYAFVLGVDAKYYTQYYLFMPKAVDDAKIGNIISFAGQNKINKFNVIFNGKTYKNVKSTVSSLKQINDKTVQI